MALNPTYKHLEQSLRIGAFTLSQWAQILLATVLALIFGVYLSPLPLTVTIFISIVLAGSPLALSYGAMSQEWSVAEALRAQWRWLRYPRRYLAGPSRAGRGYVVLRAPGAPPEASSVAPSSGDHASELWDL